MGDESIEEIRFQRINGKAFLELTDDDLRELFPLIGERKAIQRRISSFKPKPNTRVTYIINQRACTKIVGLDDAGVGRVSHLDIVEPF